MNKVSLFAILASLLLLCEVAEAKRCTGEVIQLSDGWKMTENKALCEEKKMRKRTIVPQEFLSSIDKSICVGKDEPTSATYSFNEYNLDITVKGPCRDGKKHGNFSYSDNGKTILVTKFQLDEFVKTNCVSNPDNRHSPHLECFINYLNE